MLDQGVPWGLNYSQNARQFSSGAEDRQGAIMHNTAATEQGIQRQSTRLVFWLKLVMITGFGWIVFGHYLWVGLKLPETMGVPGIIIVACCCAFGLILSLPTKIYLTLLFMQRESVARDLPQRTETPCKSPGSSNND